ncbi:hypothetical protein LX36DRAFT_136013 [Colletotrichum falcatum]|nr:hypothetical protein LX36DRAFT_136013 [Colletotrichum falcatum]
MMQQADPASHDLWPRTLPHIEGPTTLLSERPLFAGAIATRRSQSQVLCRLCLMEPLINDKGLVARTAIREGKRGGEGMSELADRRADIPQTRAEHGRWNTIQHSRLTWMPSVYLNY